MTKPGDVPCGPCRACCRNTDVVLLSDEGDIVASYDHEMITFPGNLGTFAFLRKKTNGDCVYLDRDGCSIHARRPHICREFDCRVWFLSNTREKRRAMSKDGPAVRGIFNAGRERLRTLDIFEMRKMSKP